MVQIYQHIESLHIPSSIVDLLKDIMAPSKEESTAEETNKTNSTTQIFSWEDCRRFIGRLSLPFTTLSPSLNSRRPSETRAFDKLRRYPANRIRYKAWGREIRSDYGT